MTISISERLAKDGELLRRIKDAAQIGVRVAIPGTVVSFNAEAQTVTVQPTIKERINLNGVVSHEALPPLPDVPLVLPRAGGFLLSLPVAPGDEVLVVFADMCIDGWWQSGGVQNQIDRRRHDLSDGFAILGTWSQPRLVSNYSAESAQLRNEDGTVFVEITADDEINITSTVKVTVNAPEVALSGEWDSLRKLIDERFIELFNTHRHLIGGGMTGYPSEEISAATCATLKVKGQ